MSGRNLTSYELPGLVLRISAVLFEDPSLDSASLMLANIDFVNVLIYFVLVISCIHIIPSRETICNF